MWYNVIEKGTTGKESLPISRMEWQLQIDEIIWLSEFVEKLARKHNVTPTEVEEVLANQPLFRFVNKGKRIGEDVYSVMGQTDAGRYLIVYFILKPYHRALVVSARDMDRKERREYGKRR